MEQITITRLTDNTSEIKISGDIETLVTMVYSAIKQHEKIKDIFLSATSSYMIDVLEEQERIRMN